MKKMIIVNKTLKEMSIEEVIKEFKPLMMQMSREKQIGIGINQMEVEDIYNELLVELWKCYSNYDYTKGYAFSTLLTTYCKNRRARLCQKNNDKKEMLVDEDDFNIFNEVGEDDEYFTETIQSDMMKAIIKDDRDKQIVKLLAQGMKKQDIAKEIGMSRPGLYKVINKMQDRAMNYMYRG